MVLKLASEEAPGPPAARSVPSMAAPREALRTAGRGPFRVTVTPAGITMRRNWKTPASAWGEEVSRIVSTAGSKSPRWPSPPAAATVAAPAPGPAASQEAAVPPRADPSPPAAAGSVPSKRSTRSRSTGGSSPVENTRKVRGSTAQGWARAKSERGPPPAWSSSAAADESAVRPAWASISNCPERSVMPASRRRK